MTEFFSRNNIRGVIFDCDGVLVDSEKLSCSALNVIFEKHFNVDIGKDYSPVVGKSVTDGIKYYISKHEINVSDSVDVVKLGKEKDEAYMSLARNKLQSLPGVIEVLDYLQTDKTLISVASSGSINKITFNLEQGKLKKYFQIVSSADEVKKGKPNPDLFLLSAQKMNLEPQQCAVIEDSVSGIKGAKAANMLAIGVTNTFDKESLISAGADIVVTRLDELLKL